MHPTKLDLPVYLTVNHDEQKRFNGENQAKIKTVGIYPNKLDLTSQIYLTVIL